MTLSDYASIGTLISSLAVLVSLVFLTLQVRQTERNQRAMMNQGVMARDNAIMMMVQQPDVMKVWTKAAAGATDYTSTEIQHFSILLRAIMGQMQDAHVQKLAGVLSNDTYAFVELGLRYVFALPLARALWEESRPTVSPLVAKLVDGFIAEAATLPPGDTLPATIKSRIEQQPRIAAATPNAEEARESS
jgi:hypothetical protein